MRWVEAALSPPPIARLLAEHGLGSGPPAPVHRAVPSRTRHWQPASHRRPLEEHKPRARARDLPAAQLGESGVRYFATSASWPRAGARLRVSP